MRTPAQAQVRDGLAPGRDLGLASRRRGPPVEPLFPARPPSWEVADSPLITFQLDIGPCAGTPRQTRLSVPPASTLRRSRNGPRGYGRTARQSGEWRTEVLGHTSRGRTGRSPSFTSAVRRGSASSRWTMDLPQAQDR